MENIVNTLKNSHNLVLTGAPGTGKTYLAKKIAEAMNAETEFVQFHPSYDYTDFVEGLRPTKPDSGPDIGFVRTDGVFKSFCNKAIDSSSTFVFIIDEINRGELSKIFGELFFAIDPSYRGEKGMVKTQYQNLVEKDDLYSNGFYVPENVYIIGTMNDIDRSVESMDFAMRRRFTWIEVKAEDRIEMWDDPDDGIAEWKDEAHKRMTALNAAIEKVEGLSSAYDIGPAYFLKLKQCNGDFNQLWEYHLEGLLKEYLRGMPDAEKKLGALHNAYNQKDEGKQGGPTQLEQPVEAEGK
jgi:5-methylcytosine-specific restriction protein B